MPGKVAQVVWNLNANIWLSFFLFLFGKTLKQKQMAIFRHKKLG